MNLNRLLKNKISKNAFWIIAYKIAQAVLSLVISFLTARYLGPSNYGLISYAASIVGFTLPLMDLGFSGTLVQELVNNPDKEDSILGTSILFSLITSLVCIVFIYLFVRLANAGETVTIVVCLLYSISLVFQALELIRFWFQSKYMAKHTSIVSLSAYIIVSAYKVFLLATKKSVEWFALSFAFDYAIIGIVLILIYKKKGGHFSFSFSLGKEMLKRSCPYILSNLMICIFTETDRVMLKLMLSDEVTGIYTAAASLASMSGFVAQAIVDSARPMIFESKKESNERFELNLTRLYSVVNYLSLFVGLCFFVFSNFVISLLYGSQFTSSVAVLKIICWNPVFTFYGIVRDIWLLAEGKQKYLWKINLCGALSNVVLNYLLIPRFGACGAAFASVLTQFIANFVVECFIKSVRRNNSFIIRSYNPVILFNLLRNEK